MDFGLIRSFLPNFDPNTIDYGFWSNFQILWTIDFGLVFIIIQYNTIFYLTTPPRGFSVTIDTRDNILI